MRTKKQQVHLINRIKEKKEENKVISFLRLLVADKLKKQTRPIMVVDNVEKVLFNDKKQQLRKALLMSIQILINETDKFVKVSCIQQDGVDTRIRLFPHFKNGKVFTRESYRSVF